MNRCLTIVLAAAMLAGVMTEVGSEVPRTSHDALAQARLQTYQFRAGKADVAPKSVALLEDATARDPRNVELWNALGVAYFMQVSARSRTADSYAQLIVDAEKGQAAYERALAIEPDDAYATAGRGMALSMLANRRQRPDDIRAGVAALNRAVELDSALVPVRLMRAFTTVNLPPQLRSYEALVEDLEFLLTVSAGTRAASVLHVLLGDVYLEAGEVERARAQYAALGDAGSFAGKEARARLSSIAQKSDATAGIAQLRKNLSQCTMCHGP